MGLYFRKSINLGGGIRLNLSKSGIGISGGVKGARISTNKRGTYLNLSIPGTGIYYRTKLSGSNKAYRNTNTARSTTSRYPYQKTLVNEYTGEERTVRAASQWELDEQVRNEELRMYNNELLARRNAQIADLSSKAEELTKQAQNTINALGHIIADTISINDRLDWDKQYDNTKYPDFVFDEEAPVPKKKSFFEKLLNKPDNYNEELNDYNKRKEKAYQEYLDAKREFETEQYEHNADVNFLRENFELGEASAIEKYASIVLANSRYCDALEMDFDVSYNHRQRTIYASFLLPDINDFPVVDKYNYDRYSGEIKEHRLSDTKAKSLYEKTLFSVGIRTIHELFETIYIDGVENVVFKGYLLTGSKLNENQDNTDDVREIFEIKANRQIFQTIPISDYNIPQTLEKLEFHSVKDFSDPAEIL